MAIISIGVESIYFLKNEQKKIARETFESILDLKSSPSSLSTRARNMIEYLKEK